MRFLHVGCGNARQQHTVGFKDPSSWEEVRFDIDKDADPHVLGALTDLSAVESNSLDAIFSSHNIEHIYPWEVPTALKEFLRVLKPEGFLIVTCPDLEEVCAHIARGRLNDTLYLSPAGPVRPIDVLYGFQPAIQKGNLFMAHKGGFTRETLTKAVSTAGFEAVYAKRRPAMFDLWLLGSKCKRTREESVNLMAQHFP